MTEVLPETMVPVLDKGFLALDAALASDLAVVNGARVSFNQESDEMTDRDAGLIRFVVREHHRHRAGHSYNEWSGRYSKMDAEFYVPDNVRTQVGKPGSYSFEPVDDLVRDSARREIEESAQRAFEAYERMLEQGVAKEVARAVLPLSTYTKYYWSCNPRSLMHFCGLRNHENAQYEIQQYAAAAETFLERLMPVTHAAFVANDRTAP